VYRGKLVVSLKAQEVERRVCQEGIKSLLKRCRVQVCARARFKFHFPEAQEE
jgi:hypothetical protein